MLPVPPLDGSQLLLSVRTPPFVYSELARAGLLVLLLAMTATPLGRWVSVASRLGAETLLSFVS